MSEARDYILRNILNIFNLSAEPAELSSCSTLDKFVANANIKTVVVICLANKAFKVCLPPEIPKEGVALYISKFESANIPNSFYSFVVKPIAAFKHLNQQIENIYEPILEREENSHLSQIKELKAALMTQAKPRFQGEDDTSFCTLADEFEYWQGSVENKVAERNVTILKHYEPIRKAWLRKTPLHAFCGLVQKMFHTLFTVWNNIQDYREKRFVRVLQVFAVEVSSRVKDSFDKEGMLVEQTFDCKQMLVDAITCTKKFGQLLQGHVQRSKRKLTTRVNIKIVKELHEHLKKTYRTKNVIQTLCQLYSQRKIDSDPSSLNYLLSVDSFLSGSSQFQNDKNMQLRLEGEKNNYAKFILESAPTIQAELVSALQKQNALPLLQTLRKWFYFFSYPSIIAQTAQEQQTASRKLKQYLEQLNATHLKLIQTKKSVPAKAQLLLCFKAKLKQVLNLLRGFAEQSQSFQVFNQFCNTLLQTIASSESNLIEEFKTQYETALKDKSQRSKLLGKVVICLTHRDQQIFYESSDQHSDFIPEGRHLIKLGYRDQLSEGLLGLMNEADKFRVGNCTLHSVVMKYNAISQRMHPSRKKLFQKELQEVQRLVLHPPVAKKLGEGSYEWRDISQLTNYIGVIDRSVEKILEALKDLNTAEGDIEQSAMQLLQIEFHPHNFFVLSQKVEHVARILTKVAAGRDGQDWRQLWLDRITKIVGIGWQKALLRGIPIEVTTSMLLGTNRCMFDPPLYELKEKYFGQLRQCISWPLEMRDLHSEGLIEAASQLITNNYRQAEQVFKDIEHELHNYERFFTVLNFALQRGEETIDNDTLLSQLTKLQDIQDKVQRIQEQKQIHSVSVELLRLKTGLRERTEVQIDTVVQLVRFNVKVESQRIEDYLGNVMKSLEKKPSTMVELAAAFKQFVDIQTEKQAIQAQIRKLQSHNDAIRPIVDVPYDLSGLLQRLDNFELAFLEMENILQDHRARIGEETKRKGDSLEQQASKLSRTYQQIKLERKDLSRTEVLELCVRIKQWQAQWDSLSEEYATMRKDLQAAKMSNSKQSVYDEISKKLTQEMSSWRLLLSYRAQVEQLEKEEWLIFRSHLARHGDLVEGLITQAKELSEKDNAGQVLRKMADEDRQVHQLLRCMTGENFEKEHWGMLFSILKIKHVQSADKLKLGDLLASDILSKSQQIRELQSRSRGQVAVRDALEELQTWCITRQFELTDYNSLGRVTWLIREWKDAMTEVCDNHALALSTKDSRYAARFKAEIQKQELRFGLLDRVLLTLNQIQRKWIYLEPIFMRGALPEEQGRWRRIDDQYRNIMANIGKDPHIVLLAAIPGFIDTLSAMMVQLQRCQKALNDFLEQKRGKFPRFYFLGDDDMLQILGQAQNPGIIQQHLKKMFSGINRVVFVDSDHLITAMRSHLQEEVVLNQRVEVTETVEDWLVDLASRMVSTLQDSIRRATALEVKNNFQNYSSQIICLSNELQFNRRCSKALPSGRSSLEQLRKESQQELQDLAHKCHNIDDTLQLAKMKSLILDYIHHIEIIQLLLLHNTSSLTDWHWHKQLHFVLSQREVDILMANSSFIYSFQYEGNAQKLVYTPLTDKCYLTLTQAMHMGLGGNPYGPAGTGKTESVKALALAFGRQVLVFNCDQGLDFHSMGRIFIGLVKCGAWGCFDQFNRLLEEQLSAISQQIQIIQQAIKARKRTLELLGTHVEVNFNSAIFVTLNPAGKGYGGRSKLPDNLKQLFRPIAMSVPDNELIAEVLLFSEGFRTAKILAQKIIIIFTLSRQLLSKQLHYDWGLRALKTVLSVAGRLVFEEGQSKSGAVTDQIESEILIKALRINTISKLTFNDLQKFNALVEDVFPNITIKDIVYTNLSEAVAKVFKAESYEMLPAQLSKILQFYEATRQRIGTVLVGPSGSGKTTIWSTLKKAYELLGMTIKVHLINPKAMPRSTFLGHMNNDTRQFSEGVLTSSARQVVKEEKEVHSWIICDGDVDPEWIEALNSVLDDNHLLTLPTGQRISFGANVNFIFQTDNLQFASPATVSRMGMIFMNDEDINIKSIIGKWARSMTAQQDFLVAHIETIEQACSSVWQLHPQLIVDTTKVGLVRSALSLLDGCNSELDFKLNLMKGLVCNFKDQTREQIYQEIVVKPQLSGRDPLSLCQIQGKVTQYEDDSFSGLHRIYPVKELKKDMAIVTHWLRRNQNIIIVGKQGCGKSLLLQASIQQLQREEKCRVSILHCNRETKAASLITKLYQNTLKATFGQSKILKPLNCSRLIVVLKEVNLVKPDKYQTMQLIAFLQSVVTHEGFYDENLEFIRIGKGIQFACIMKPATTLGRHQLTTRFVSNFQVLHVDYGPVGILEKLSHLTPHASVMHLKLNLFWQCLQLHFKPDDHSHYLFCPRNLNAMADSLAHYAVNMSVPEEVAAALANEASKQFEDRIVDQAGKTVFKTQTEGIFGKSTQAFILSDGKLKPVHQSAHKSYLQKQITAYCREVDDAKVILVPEVQTIMASLERKIVEGGSLLMAGSSGSLRKTAVKIVANTHKIPVLSLSNLRNPSLKDFLRDIRSSLQQAAGQDRKIILFLQEHQLGRSEFYEKINSLMSSGEISGLFNADEIEALVQDVPKLRSECVDKSLYEGFIQRIRRNVLIVLSIDHRNKTFHDVCSSNPAFYSCCTVIWSNCYAQSSLEALFEDRLKEVELKEKQEIKAAMIKIHTGSSLKYLQLLANFLNVLGKVQSTSGSKLGKLNQGLKKLRDTAKLVDELTVDAREKQKRLSVKQKQATESLNFITDVMQEQSAKKNEAQKLREFLEVEQKKNRRDRELVMQELDKVQPLIEEAKTAVSGLTPKNIQQIRSFSFPPDAVKHVLKAVLSLFGSRDDSWNSMKIFLKNCKDQILQFDIRSVTENVRRQVEQIIAEHANSFQRENVFKASQDAVPFADWVKAAIEYSKTYEKVRPLEQNLAHIEHQLARSRVQLKECEKQIIELEQAVGKLNDDFVRKTNEAEVLKKELQQAETALACGQDLLAKLQGERVRWERESEKLEVEVQLSPKYAALTACYITYLSDNPENVRQSKVQRWKKLLDCHYFSFLSFVGNEALTLQQVLKGLPKDQLSIENSEILKFVKQVPLIIDPNGEALNWLRSKLAEEGTVESLTQQDPKFMNILEMGVRFGKTLLLQEIDYIEAVLTAVLKRDYTRQGARSMLQLNDKTFEVSDTFRLLLATRNSSIQIVHNQKDLVTIINFSVTKSGLEAKLLSSIISHFQPELELQKQELLLRQETLKISLAELEDRVLKELGDSSGDILENKALVHSLNDTKSQSEVVGNSLKESEQLQRVIDQKRQVYNGVADIGARLYLSLLGLCNLNPMYRYNLSQFMGLFKEALVGEGKIEHIKETLIQIIFENVSLGLLKAHRLLLGIVIIRDVLERVFAEQEYNVLVGQVVADAAGTIPDWLDQKGKDLFRAFVSVVHPKEQFASAKWKEWFLSSECEQKFPPNNLSPFQQCLLVNSCRPDRLINSLSEFVTTTLKLQNLSGAIGMEQLCNRKMTKDVPCLFIVSVGFDPSKQIQEYAERVVGKQRFQELSMGGDQNERALVLLRESAKEGRWLCLKNLHLVIQFVGILEKQLCTLEPHDDFRLFLTTEIHDKFSPILLQRCYKVSYEAPPGLKQNFTRLLASQHSQQLGDLEILATYFHSIIQQRRNYIPQGWNKLYEFNYSDYRTGLRVINDCRESTGCNWTMLNGLMLDTVYGGRIDNDVDRRLLNVYLQQFFNHEVLTGNKPIYKQLPIKDRRALLDNLPANDSPQLYNLPMGIGMATLRLKARELVDNLKLLQLGSVEASKFSRQAWSKSLSPFLLLWNGLLKSHGLGNRSMQPVFKYNSLQPLENFIYSEYQQAVATFQYITQCLQSLEGVLSGSLILTTQVERLGRSILQGETPSSWRCIWQGPDLITDWIKLFLGRLAPLDVWKSKADKNSLLSVQLNLAELYRPAIFLNALKQKAGRAKKIPLNQLQIQASLTVPQETIYAKVVGLVLQGCSLSRQSLAAPRSDSEYEDVPLLYLYYNEKTPDPKDFLLPFYTDMSRETLLAMLPMRTEISHEQHILASAALLLREI